MPITILNPHRSEPWAHAVQGLSGALEAYQRYKADERDHKIKLEEVALRRQESEDRRKERDYLHARQEEEDNIKIEQERIGLGQNLEIGRSTADLGDMIKETTSTGFVAPKVDTGAGLGAGLLGKTEQAGPPSELIRSAARPDVGPFETKPISSLTDIISKSPFIQAPKAPLEDLVAPQLQTAADRMASNMAIRAAEFATPTGKLSARERALGRQGIVDTAWRREVGESERRDKVAAAQRAQEWKERDELEANRERARDERLAITTKAAAERAEKAQAAAMERAALAVSRGNREAAEAHHVEALANGGTLAMIPKEYQAAASNAARRAGVTVFETPKQKAAYEVADTTLAEADELKRLLQTDKDVKAAFGQVAGRWNVSATSGLLSALPGEVPQSVRRAIQLAQNLNDLRLRQRSGAAISEAEAARLGKFSFDPTVPSEQMLVNIDPYVAELRAIRDGNSVTASTKTGAKTEAGGKKVDPNDPEGLLSQTEKAMREATGNSFGLTKPPKPAGSR